MGAYLFVAVKARMAERESAKRLIDQVNAVQDALKVGISGRALCSSSRTTRISTAAAAPGAGVMLRSGSRRVSSPRTQMVAAGNNLPVIRILGVAPTETPTETNMNTTIFLPPSAHSRSVQTANNVLTGINSMTLYTFDKDAAGERQERSQRSLCGNCRRWRQRWKPRPQATTASSCAMTAPGSGIQGQAAHFWAKDQKPGDQTARASMASGTSPRPDRHQAHEWP